MTQLANEKNETTTRNMFGALVPSSIPHAASPPLDILMSIVYTIDISEGVGALIS